MCGVLIVRRIVDMIRRLHTMRDESEKDPQIIRARIITNSYSRIIFTQPII